MMPQVYQQAAIPPILTLAKFFTYAKVEQTKNVLPGSD